jgi:hypothetical protein
MTSQYNQSRPRLLATSLHSLMALALMALGSAAHASGGVVVVFGPAATSVPTLSESMLLVLTLLVAVVAWRGMRDKAIGKPVASLVLAGVLMLGAGSGGWLRPAFAFVGFNVDGGTPFSWATPATAGTDYSNTNAGTKPAQVVSVTYLAGSDVTPPLVGTQCTAGLIIAPAGSCSVRFNVGP